MNVMPVARTLDSRDSALDVSRDGLDLTVTLVLTGGLDLNVILVMSTLDQLDNVTRVYLDG